MSLIFLAPMEGLADVLMRDLLTRLGPFDGAVCQFIRVAEAPMPARAFRRVCPELDNGGRTASGTPMAVQLLGNAPAFMASSAARVARLAPPAIDLNFGCPAPTVNRRGAGATLLDDPEILLRIASAVRRAVPPAIPVTAKMRLGVRDTSLTLDCARALAAAGIARLTVHARTRIEGYRPPAHWEWIARVREVVSVPVMANGEIWTPADYRSCLEISGCSEVMLGRGAVADPFLVQRLRGARAEAVNPEAEWSELAPLLHEFWQRVQGRLQLCHAPGRLKLWLDSLRRHFPQAEALHGRIRAMVDVPAISAALDEATGGKGMQTPDGLRLRDTR